MLQRSRETRQQYLDAMGITLWVRPEIRDLRAAEAPVPAARSQPEAEPVYPRVRSVKPPTDLKQSEPGSEVRGQEKTEATQPSGTLPTTSHGGIEFIQQWWAANGWLVIDTRPASISNKDQQNCDRLIGYLGHYLTGQARPEIAHYIDWPLFENPAIKHDLEEARVYLQQKWDSIVRRMSLTGVLLLGDWSEHLLSSGLSDQSEASSLTVIHGPGVSDMLNDVAAKRLLWQELQRV